MVRTCREKDRGRCSNENMEDKREWTLKDRNTKWKEHIRGTRVMQAAVHKIIERTKMIQTCDEESVEDGYTMKKRRLVDKYKSIYTNVRVESTGSDPMANSIISFHDKFLYHFKNINDT